MKSARDTGVLVDPSDIEQQLPRPHAPNRLAHIVFKTPRPDEMAQWYTHTLDAVVVFRNKRVTFLTYDEEHHRIALVTVPKAVRLPARGWKFHRKLFGVDHIAFTYPSLQSLVANYRRLAGHGIVPVWCINHGPTTSMYYEDPDGNRLELQVDNFESNPALMEWIAGGEFEANPIGVEFDPDVLGRLVDAGASAAELARRGSAPPDGRKPRSGMRTIRWKTL
ncbi:MAG: VOC family protein [Mycobacterium sp.]|nr:VOC family protein [Mycobacterium sp.]